MINIHMYTHHMPLRRPKRGRLSRRAANPSFTCENICMYTYTYTMYQIHMIYIHMYTYKHTPHAAASHEKKEAAWAHQTHRSHVSLPLPSLQKNLSLRSYKKRKKSQKKQHHINMYGCCPPKKKRLDTSSPLPSSQKNLSLRSYKNGKKYHIKNQKCHINMSPKKRLYISLPLPGPHKKGQKKA